MNFEAVFYYALTPLACGFAPFAGSLAAAAVLWRWFRGSWAGVAQQPKSAWPFFKDAGLALFFFTLFYIPVPNPGRLIGFEDHDVDLQVTQTDETTVAIFMLERLSYGLDALMVQSLSWEASMAAILAQEEAYIEDDQPLRIARPPNSADAIYSFIVARAQFVKKYADLWWAQARLAEPEADNPDEPKKSFWGFVKALSPDQQIRFLVRQITAIFYSVAAFFGLAVFYLVFLAFSVVLLGLAGVGKYGAIFLFGIALFVYPFAYLLHGRKALLSILNALGGFLFLKAGAVLLCWLSFFIIEGVVLQGLMETMREQAHVQDMIAQAAPGYLYTQAGSELLTTAENLGGLHAGTMGVSRTLLAMLVVLLAMAYIALKLPALLSNLLGAQSMADDLNSSLIFIGGALVSMGAALKAKLAFGAAAKATGNVLSTASQSKTGGSS